MMLSYAYLLIPLACLLTTTVNSIRVLGIFPIAAKSHFSTNLAIMESLHAAGHQITMISPFPPLIKNLPNFTHVDSQTDGFVFVGQSTFEELYEMTVRDHWNILVPLNIKYCYDVMKLTKIQEALNTERKLYDVVFVEQVFAYECYLPIARKLGIPIIGTVTLRSYKLSSVGSSDNPAVIPLELSPRSKVDMNFVERAENLWNHIVFEYYYKIKIRPELVKFYREHSFEDSPAEKEAFSMVFVNNHPTFMPRTSRPNVVEIGGIHVKPANPLPENIQKFIDDATHGVILFTFGSVVKTSTLSSAQKNAFLTAFASLPQRVLWKFEEPIENLPKNIMTSRWFPQRNILEHRNVIAFMSHCGQGGVYEAIVTATPVVAIPIFADQQSNADILRFRGVCVKLDLMSVTKEAVVDAFNTIINDTSYRQRMQELSRTFKDRPMSPQELTVYWTEYVVRHNGASHLTPLGSTMPLYKYLMLDILVLAISIMSLVLFVIGAVIQKIYRALVGNPPTKEANVAKKNL